MLTVTQRPEGVLHVYADERLTTDDYDVFVPSFERLAESAGRLPMLIELRPDFTGWDASAFWRALKFDVRHKDSFGRMAIVGDERWQEWGVKASNLLFEAEIKFFQPHERTRAEDWLLENRSEEIGAGL